MKKLLAIASVCALSASMIACGNPTPKTNTATYPETPSARIATRDTDISDNQTPPQTDEDTPDGVQPNEHEHFGKKRRKPLIPGVRRLLSHDANKTYTVEYIHVPYGVERDETLDYNLTLMDDNTFELTVVSDGVTAEHNGHWYKRKQSIMLFYDEEIDQPAHNVYVADSLYGELLPHGKILIYDKCHTIILSHNRTDNDDNTNDTENISENTNEISR